MSRFLYPRRGEEPEFHGHNIPEDHGDGETIRVLVDGKWMDYSKWASSEHSCQLIDPYYVPEPPTHWPTLAERRKMVQGSEYAEWLKRIRRLPKAATKAAPASSADNVPRTKQKRRKDGRDDPFYIRPTA